MSDIAAFILARLDERERVAQAAIRDHEKAVREFLAFRLTLADGPDDSLVVTDPDEQPGRWSGGTNEDGDGHYMCGVWAADGIKLVATMHDEGDLATAEHIALHDPARVLAEVAVKRAIVELYEHKRQSMALHPNQGNAGGFMALENVVRLLAVPYADREDYQQEWAPA